MREEYKKENFENESIQVDGNTYKSCKFKDSELKFGAIKPVSFVDCSFENVSWHFIDHAEITFDFLTALYQAGGEEIIETLFDNIRSGKKEGE